jgi:hypothetical protein
MSNFQEIEQEIAPCAINGVYYGPHNRVLARTQDWVLLWCTGRSQRGGGLHNIWYPASMMIVARTQRPRPQYRRVCDNERCHNRVFAKVADKIDAVFGEGFHALLDVKKTIVVGDNGKISGWVVE